MRFENKVRCIVTPGGVGLCSAKKRMATRLRQDGARNVGACRIFYFLFLRERRTFFFFLVKRIRRTWAATAISMAANRVSGRKRRPSRVHDRRSAERQFARGPLCVKNRGSFLNRKEKKQSVLGKLEELGRIRTPKGDGRSNVPAGARGSAPKAGFPPSN